MQMAKSKNGFAEQKVKSDIMTELPELVLSCEQRNWGKKFKGWKDEVVEISGCIRKSEKISV